MLRTILMALGGLLLSACTVPATESQPVIEPHYRLEPLHAAAVTVDDFLQISVTSTGCTLAEDFVVHVAEAEGQCAVSIYRTRSDRCRRMPFVLPLELAIRRPAGCEGLPVVIRNAQAAELSGHRQPLVDR